MSNYDLYLAQLKLFPYFILAGIILTAFWAYYDKDAIIRTPHVRRTSIRMMQAAFLSMLFSALYDWHSLLSDRSFIIISALGILITWVTFYCLFSYALNKVKGNATLYIGKIATTDKLTRQIWGDHYELGGLFQRLLAFAIGTAIYFVA